MNKSPKFDLIRTFPANDPTRVLQVRFLMAAQALAAIGRLPGFLPNTPATRETKNYLMVLSIAAAYEAALAFEEADEGHAFDELLAADWSEMNSAVGRLRFECDEKKPESLRKKILVVARNTVGFHWDPKIIGRCVGRLGEAEVSIWAGAEEQTVADTALPLVSALIHEALRYWIGSQEEVDDVLRRIIRVQGDLFDVAHAMLATAVKNAGTV